MAQLRKMLGDISSEECVALMHLIETQSKSTLSKWAIEYARRNYLTVYQRHCADDHTMAGLLAVCRAYAMGEGELKQAKNAIKMMRQRARELASSRIAQAAPVHFPLGVPPFKHRVMPLVFCCTVPRLSATMSWALPAKGKRMMLLRPGS